MTDLPIIWTPEQVAKLNEWQACPWVHPFTCGSAMRHDEAHRRATRPGFEPGTLVATTRGWVCPGCAYSQTWAHDFMFAGAPPPPFGGKAP